MYSIVKVAKKRVKWPPSFPGAARRRILCWSFAPAAGRIITGVSLRAFRSWSAGGRFNMWTRFLLASALLALIGTASPALELKNVRPSFGPLGATRTDVKCLPGDVLFINYDIDGLKFDEKNGKANYTTILELIDSNNKVIFR